MKWRTGRVVLLLAATLIVFFAVWTFWVPTRDPGGRVIARRGWVRSVAWSPDGESVLYSDWAPTVPDSPLVCLAKADGSGTQVIHRGRRTVWAGWLGNPPWPAVIVTRGNWPNEDRRIFAIDSRTLRKKRISLPFQAPRGQSWVVAPSLTKAALLALDRAAQTYGVAVTSSTGRQRMVTRLARGGVPSDTRWSPDEERLAFLTLNIWRYSRKWMAFGLQVVDLVDGSRTTLVTPIEGLHGLSWSGNSKEIAFYITRADAVGRALEWAEGICEPSSWGWLRRRGDFLGDRANRHTRSVIHAVRVKDGKVRELLRLPKGTLASDISLSPTGKQVAVACWPDQTIRIFDIPKPKPGDWGPAEDVLPGFHRGH